MGEGELLSVPRDVCKRLCSMRFNAHAFHLVFVVSCKREMNCLNRTDDFAVVKGINTNWVAKLLTLSRGGG